MWKSKAKYTNELPLASYLTQDNTKKETQLTKIETRRKYLGLSRSELSRLSDVPLRTIEDWERGKNKPTNVMQLQKVARVLNCAIEDIIEPL